MGTVGRSIVGTSVVGLIDSLNKALASEWEAYYLYWIAAKVCKGILAKRAIHEFKDHAKQEYDHANDVANRIIELGGTPLTSLYQVVTNTTIATVADADIAVLLQQVLQSERDAIRIYQALSADTNGTDFVTNDLVVDILGDECSHEEDIERLIDDLNSV
jgi:bacterioferritin